MIFREDYIGSNEAPVSIIPLVRALLECQRIASRVAELRQDNRSLDLDARLSRARQTARLRFPNLDLKIEKRNGVPAPASR